MIAAYLVLVEVVKAHLYRTAVVTRRRRRSHTERHHRRVHRRAAPFRRHAAGRPGVLPS
jgi:hypothetical protein